MSFSVSHICDKKWWRWKNIKEEKKKFSTHHSQQFTQLYYAVGNNGNERENEDEMRVMMSIKHHWWRLFSSQLDASWCVMIIKKDRCLYYKRKIMFWCQVPASNAMLMRLRRIMDFYYFGKREQNLEGFKVDLWIVMKILLII